MFHSKLKTNAGFSLTELMVVVAIIGILAAMAIPQFQRFMAKAKQAEAKTNVNAIATLQESYFGDNDTYYNTPGDAAGVSLPGIGFYAEGNPRYWYQTQSTTGTWYVNTATSVANLTPSCGVIDPARDTWWYTNAPGNNGKIMSGPEYSAYWIPVDGVDCSTY